MAGPTRFGWRICRRSVTDSGLGCSPGMRPLLQAEPARARSIALVGLRGHWHYDQIAKGIFEHCRADDRLSVGGVYAVELARRSEAHRIAFHAALEAADAVITTLSPNEKWMELRAGRIPPIVVSARAAPAGFPSVLADDVATGRMAAEFFLNRGFRQFAFLGHGGFHFSDERQRGFAEHLAAAGYRPEVHQIDGVWKVATLDAREENLGALLRWLVGLPKPCALFCANDVLGTWALRKALSAGIPVPEDLAVLGVDNEPEHITLSPIGLSSISLKSEAIGIEAARLADRMLDGEPPPAAPIRIPPSQIETRASTDVAVASDPTVRRALGVLHSRFNEPLRISEIARLCHVSRRLLEVRFRETLHRTPREELERIRLHAARRLLLQTDRNLDEIAERTGFSHAGLLISRFRALFGETPGKFRARVAEVGEKKGENGAGCRRTEVAM